MTGPLLQNEEVTIRATVVHTVKSTMTFFDAVPSIYFDLERLKDRWVIHMKEARLNGVSVELADFIKLSAKQGRVRYVPEYEALSIESQKELLSVSLSVNIKEWLRIKWGQTGKSMQDVAAVLLEEVYRCEQDQSGDNVDKFPAFN